jgi:hypothetical protein
VAAAIAKSGWLNDITEVVSGCATGADTCGEIWAGMAGKQIKKFPADWERYGKAAGAMRNLEMARYADALIAVWDGESKGTSHMIRVAKDKGLKVYVHNISDPFVQADLGL